LSCLIDFLFWHSDDLVIVLLSLHLVGTGGDQPSGAKRYTGMPARSKKQQKAAGAALAAKRGEQKKSSLKGPSKKMAESMSEKQLRDLAKTKRKKLPTKKK
jgi:hypothetical protein